MRLAIVGSGDMGSAIAVALTQRTKHRVFVRGSHPESSSATALMRELGIAYADDQVLSGADVVFAVVPWDALDAIAHVLQRCRGVIVSVVVPWANGGDPRTDARSAAERLAHLLPHVRIVNAFTSISSSLIRNPGKGEKPSVIACSDDDEARTIVMGLAREIGFDAVNGGKLISARYAEGLGLLWTHLAFEAGYGDRVTFRVYVLP